MYDMEQSDVESTVSGISQPSQPSQPATTPEPPAYGLIQKTQQKEQESFFGKLFKTGWGSSEKESKQKDPRSTVNPMGGDMGM